jgi:SAM-dependent methyltransferase
MLKSFVKSIFPALWLSWCKRRMDWLLKCLLFPRHSFLQFTCNICSETTRYPRKSMMREVPSCVHCGSCVRFRSIIHTLSVELFGESLAIKDFPERQDLIGIGMSDWDGYANRLPEKLGYTNTFYHREPLLDIASLDPLTSARYDFVIATEVFEHVSQPIPRAFENVHRLLKPGGVLIFSVPCAEGETREHFPELWRYTIGKENNSWVLVNETKDGRRQRYDKLTFHDGPGTTIEMRLFGKDSLSKNFTDAGFRQIRVHDEEVEAFGIVWNRYIPEEAPYRPLIYGLDAPTWSARRE